MADAPTIAADGAPDVAIPSGAPLPERERIDARDKVLGATRYAADVVVPDTLFAMTVPAAIAEGRIASSSSVAAMAVPGVPRVLTADDFPPPVLHRPRRPSPPTSPVAVSRSPWSSPKR